MKDEIWKTIPEYENLYMISNKGRVKRLKRGYLKDDRILVNQVDRHGYERVSLTKDRKVKTVNIHRLLGMTFLQYPIPDKLEVCHIDGNKRNNELSNLRIDTKLSNQKDKLIHGTSLRGTKNNHNKLTNEEVISIFKDKRKQVLLSKEYKVSQNVISNIKHGKIWGWLTENIN